MKTLAKFLTFFLFIHNVELVIAEEEEDCVLEADLVEFNTRWPYQIDDIHDGNLTCVGGWERRGYYCYKLFDTELTQESAESQCESVGGQLVKLEDTSVILFNVKEILRDNSTILKDYAWTGLEITDWTNCTGEWTDGTIGGCFNGRWMANQPMQGRGNCVALSACSGRFTLKPCTERLPYICQQRACPNGDFHCTNDICVQPRTCDGINDCGDWSDELLDECPDTYTVLLTESQPTATFDIPTADYNNSDQKFIKFEGPANTKVQVSITSFVTEQDKDVLDVYMGGNTFDNSIFLTSVSGRPSENQSFVSVNNLMLFRFATDVDEVPSDGGISFTGTIEFPCEFESEPFENMTALRSPDDTLTSESLQQCLNSCSMDSSCLAVSYEAGEDMPCRRNTYINYLVEKANAQFYRKTCPQTSGTRTTTLPNGSGELVATPEFKTHSSPYYPNGGVFKNQDLLWSIESDGGVITFTAIDMDDLADGDVVKVYDGVVRDENKLLEEYRADQPGKSFVVSTGPNIVVTYKSVAESPGRGINFGYERGCRASVVTSFADFCTPGADYEDSPGYPELLDCDWEFFPEDPDEPFSMLFGPVDIQARDYLMIYTGRINMAAVPEYPHVEYTEVVNTEGSRITRAPDTNWNSTSYIRVKFTTNSVTTGDGFCATISGGCSPLNITDPNIRLYGLDNLPISTIPREFNSTVHITCANGYVLASEELEQCPSSNNTNWYPLTCGKNGQWNVRAIPECTKRSCGRPTEPSNGFISTLTGVETNDTVTYSCVPGLSLNGSRSSVCMENGLWSEPPNCIGGECPGVSNPANGFYRILEGEMRGGQFTQDTIIEFECNPGYYLTKGNKAYCRNSIWTGDVDAVCDPLFCKIPRVQRGEVTSQAGQPNDIFVPHGEDVELDCDEGYVVANTTSDIMMFTCDRSNMYMSDGSFGPNWEMRMVCDDENECNNSSPCTQMCVNTVGSYRCECREGFELGNDRSTCNDIDECDILGALPQCVKMIDGKCMDIIQRCHTCTNNVGGFTCGCDAGFELWRHTAMDIYPPGYGEDGMDIWHMRVENVSCVRKSCDGALLPDGVSGGVRVTYQDHYFFEQKVEYSCGVGTSVGDSTRAVQYLECDENGNWVNPDLGNSTLQNCTTVICDGIDISGLSDRIDLVSPNLPDGAENPKQFESIVNFNCTIPGGMVEQRQQQCVFDTANDTYRFVGDSLECKKIDCGPLPFISGLNTTNINSTDTFYGYGFDFICEDLFILSGNGSDAGDPDRVTCQSDGKWGLGNLNCDGPTCTDPGTPPNARQVPVGAAHLSYELGAQVNYECVDDGYTYNGGVLRCINNGTAVVWNGTFGECRDTEHPVLYGCPNETLQFYTYQRFEMQLPTATDNVEVKEVLPGVALGSVLTGDATFLIDAFDFSGNRNSCIVSVTVSDPSAPEFFDNCTTPRTIVIGEVYTETFTNESLRMIMSEAEILKLESYSFEPSYFSVGEEDIGNSVAVVVSATNVFNENSSCTILYEVQAAKCAMFALPSNNVVRTINTNTQITLRCLSNSYIFAPPYASQNSIMYTCNPDDDGVWKNGGNAYVPDCTPKLESKFVVDVEIQYKYEDGSSFNSTCQDGVDALSQTPEFITNERNFITTLNNPIFGDNGDCEMDLEKIEASSGTFSILGNIIVVYKYTLRQKPGILADSDVQGDCQSVLKSRYKKNYLDPPQSARGHPTISGANHCTQTLTALASTTGKTEADVSGQLECSGAGEVLFGDVCAKCARGYFYDGSTGTCMECPLSAFQDLEGQTSCKDCGSGKYTALPGAQNSSQCLDTCPPGYIGMNGFISPCRRVQPNYYWVAANNETMCPPDRVNQQGGGKDINDCKAPCAPGEFSASGYAPCKACPQGYYGVNTTHCEPCPQNNQSTQTTGAGGVGMCTTNTTMLCSNVDCGVNGTCLISNNFPTCVCAEGYTGRYCEIPPNPCGSAPCYNDGTCVNFNNNTFECKCSGEDTQNMVLNMNETDLEKAFKDDFITVFPKFGKTAAGCFQECIDTSQCVYAAIYGTREPVPGVIYSCSLIIVENLSSPTLIEVDNARKTRLLYIKETSTVPHYTGPNCEELIADPCAGTCMNGAPCYTKGHDDFECLCKSNSIFSGTYCNETENICEREKCYNDGSCDGSAVIRRTCNCTFGYYSDDCNKTINFCEPNPCLYGGSCEIRLDDPSGYFCKCSPGYSGSRCEMRPPDVCGGVVCTDDQMCYTNPVTGNYSCVCAAGKMLGDNQQTCEEIDMCAMDPCFNNGSCITDSGKPAGFWCNCPLGEYRGAQCQAEYDPCYPDENLCDLTHSVCRIDVNGTGYCVCDPGYELGDDSPHCRDRRNLCEQNYCNETGLQSCLRDGVYGIDVNDYQCQCKEGYTGRHCEFKVYACDASPCINGDCENDGDTFMCTCHPGWMGDTCSTPTDICQVDTCGAGNCTMLFNATKACICVPGEQYGENCENDINVCSTFQSQLCSGKGMCMIKNSLPTCMCNSGWTGENCQCKEDFCGGETCMNGGTCTPTPVGFTCHCDDGFTGDRCEENINDCRLIPNCTDCIDGVNEAFCRCLAGRTGPLCEKDADYNYDLQFTGVGSSKLLFPAEINTVSFTLVVFVRFRRGTSSQFLLICKAEDEAIPECSDDPPIVTIDENSLCFNGDDPGSCFVDDLGLSSGSWTRLIFIYDGTTGQIIQGGNIRNKDLSINMPQHVMIKLGGDGDFLGDVTRVELYDYVISNDERNAILRNERMGISKAPAIPFDFYRLIGTQYIYPSQFCVSQGCSEEVRNRPLVDSCPDYAFAEKRADVIRAGVSWEEPNFEPSTGLVITRNLINNGFLDGGAYDVVITATNSQNDYARCIFNAYVSYRVCPDLNATDTVDFRCDEHVDGMYTSCQPFCKDSENFVFLEPVPKKVNCGPSGVFDPVNPTGTFKISECGKRCFSLLDITFSWNYTSDFFFPQNTLDDIRDDVKLLIKRWELQNTPIALCTDADNCDNVIVTVHYSDPHLQVQVMAPSAQLEVQRDSINMSTFTAIRDAVEAVSASFDILAQSSYLNRTFAMERNEGTFEYDSTVSCEEAGCQPQTDYCVQCTAGTYLNATLQKCMPCMKDYYQNETGQESCKRCPTGQITEGEGSRSGDDCFDKCPPGQRLDRSNGNTCVDCGFSFYQSESGQIDCDQCEMGDTTLVKNATDKSNCTTACDDGQELGTDGVTCVDCPVGSFLTIHVHVRCEPCSSDKTTPGNRSVSEADCSINVCLAGEYRVGNNPGNCTKCPHGTWRSSDMNATVCTPCEGWAEMPGDMYTTVMDSDRDMETVGATNYTQCRPICGGGMFLNMLTGTCIPCAKNTFKPDNYIFATECMNCSSPRVFTQGEGSNSTEDCKYNDCNAGQTVNVVNTTCIDCPYGTYQPNPNPTDDECIPCPMRNMRNTTTAYVGTALETDCIEICPDGQELIGGDCVDCEFGYYKNNGVNHTAQYSNCTKCPTNTTPIRGSTDVSACTTADCGLGEYLNRTSNTCELCDIGYIQTVDWRNVTPTGMMDPYITECEKCPDTTSTDGMGKTSTSDCNKVCPSGQEDIDGTCTDCVRGKYKDNDVSLVARYGSCMSCNDSRTTIGTGSTSSSNCSIEVCPSGQEDINGTCTDCVRGKYKDNDVESYGSCMVCNNSMTTIGTGSTSSSNCSIAKCGLGEYRDAGTNSCMLCPNGTYNDVLLREGSCTPCGFNEVGLQLGTNDQGSISSTNCTTFPNTIIIWINMTIPEREPTDEMLDSNSVAQERADVISAFLDIVTAALGVKFIVRGYQTVDDLPVVSITRSSTILVGYFLVDSGNSGVPVTDLETESQALLNNVPTAALIDLVTSLQGSGDFTTLFQTQELDSTIPVFCAPGEGLNMVDLTCTPCPENYYHKPGNIAVCSKCPVGTTTDGLTNRTNIGDCKLSCPPGNYSSAGELCLPCPQNEYKNVTGTGSCMSCPMTDDTPQKQQITPGRGTADPDLCQGPCDKGYYYERTPGNQCTICPKGQYSDEENSLSCKSCDAYYNTVGDGSDSASDCKPLCGPDGVEPDYCMNGGACEWNEDLRIARCFCEDPYKGERCQERGEPSSDNTVILIGVFSSLGGLLVLLMVILAVRYYYISKRKQDEHEDRMKTITARTNARILASVAPSFPEIATHAGADAMSLTGYGVRQTGHPTPPGTLQGYGPTYAQNPAPSTFNPNKALYYDEREPDQPTYGTGFTPSNRPYGNNTYGATANVYGTSAGVYGNSAGVYGNSAGVYGNSAGVYGNGVYGNGVYGNAPM